MDRPVQAIGVPDKLSRFRIDGRIFKKRYGFTRSQPDYKKGDCQNPKKNDERGEDSSGKVRDHGSIFSHGFGDPPLMEVDIGVCDTQLHSLDPVVDAIDAFGLKEKAVRLIVMDDFLGFIP